MDPPVIDPAYLQDSADINLLLEGLSAARVIGRRLVERGDVLGELLPGPATAADAGLEHWARSSAESVWHPACTCRMGSDALAVVDDKLHVHGLRRLRIADASVMPTLTSANTNAPTIMIGEKAADLIRRIGAQLLNVRPAGPATDTPLLRQAFRSVDSTTGSMARLRARALARFKLVRRSPVAAA